MKRKSIPVLLRKIVAERATYRCEYCQVFEHDFFVSFEIDHILSIKHGGDNMPDNLAYACPRCNQNKSSDLGTYLPGSNRLTRLFNPRKDTWEKHFELVDGEVVPRTNIGASTVKVLCLNDPDRIILRRLFAQFGSYP